MYPSENEFERYRGSPNFRLLSDRFRIPLEGLVSAHYGQAWRVREFSDMNDLASHPSALLSDGKVEVFVKLSEAVHALHQFEAERAGLRLLTELSGVRTPAPIGIAAVEGGVILVLEAVQAVARNAPEWRDIGRALARIHQVKAERFGLDTQGYFGPLYQDNRPAPDWITFFIERRIWPRLMGAIDSGSLPTETIRQVEKLISRLPGLDIPETRPSLLHGDAQKNNFISTSSGAVAVDPALYFGNPELDLAYVDYFEAVPEDLFSGYREVLPIDPGFGERKELWRVASYLAMVEVGGAEYLGPLTAAVRKYL